MTNLEFYDKHNMVAYLKKPSGSEGFQEILDFLNGSHIRTVDNGEQEITATVDGKEFTITEASVRRHIQLADIYAEEGEGLGHPSEPQPPPFTAQPINEEPILNTSVPIPNVPDEVVYEEWDDKVERAITTAASLDAEQASGGSPRVHTLGSDEGSMTLQELTALCTKLSKQMESLEADLKQTKKVYGAAYTKLIMKGRMIEEIDQDAGITLVTPTMFSSQEDQLEDQLGVLSAAKVLADAAKKNVNTYTRRRRAFSTSSGGVSTASRLFSTTEESVSTAGASMLVSTAGMVQEVNISIPSPVVVKDKGMGIMIEFKDEQTKRTKLQQEQERLGHEAAVRLQEELDEEER
ncbi:hypothetical protein Tco_1256162 [Tanacetum coccineum]